ncbi:hypothetical protein [Burkholderia sp. WSM2230]|uniref:hypothetical protein n=1 Tax=Burkholderia sp. WSM2230 TaxID=944435 RepID=UPI0004715310|nr:hypothetical protein [Burkholderia sp. WSM2230]
MTHYIGSLKLVIANARVASLILAAEGYACAPQQYDARVDSAGFARHTSRRRRMTLGNRANGVRRDAAARAT